MTNNVFSFFFAWQNLLLLVLCVPNAFAQTGPSVEVDRIVIVESLQSDPLPSGSIKPSADISLKATIPKTESAADVVSQVAGVHIKRFGGLEDATSISIRGSTNAEVNVFLDGVPLDTASADGVGLGQIAATSLSRIEIFKSTSPSELGGSAIGGVINLSSKKAEPGLNQRYGFGFGSFMTYDGLAELSYGGVKNDVVFGFDARRTDGDFMYQDNNGTPLNPADDQEVRRQNSEKQALHPHLNWKHYFNERNEMTLAQHFFRIDAGVSGLGAFQSQTADKSLTEYLGSVAMKSRGHFGDKSALTHKTYYRLIKSQFSDPNAEIGLGRAQDNDNLTVVIGNRHMWQTDFSKKVAVKKGAEHVYERFAPRDFLAADPVGSTSARHQLNFFVEPHLYLFERKVHLSSQGQSLNVFYDINNDDPSLNDSGTFFSNKIENQFAGQMALIYSPFSAWHVKVSAGREVRLPKFVELFGDQGFVLGNPQLSSEKSFKYDIGFEGAKSFAGFVNKITVGVALFENRIDDLIQFEMASGYARASNIGEARIRGAEVMGSLRFFEHLLLTSNYTYQWPEDQSVNAGRFLVGRPRHEVNTRIGFDRKGFSAGVHANYLDAQYLDALNTQRVDDRLVISADAGYLLKQKYRLGFEVKNLTASQVVDAVGFPLPGRSYFARLDLFL